VRDKKGQHKHNLGVSSETITSSSFFFDKKSFIRRHGAEELNEIKRTER
jgi:hypothetical protein